MNDMLPVRANDGTDITEAVQILYDIVHQSMDWGSGMLDNEEMEKVIDLAVLLGFEVPPIPYNSAEQMVSVVRKYPEHYEIKTRSYTSYYDKERTITEITVVKKP